MNNRAEDRITCLDRASLAVIAMNVFVLIGELVFDGHVQVLNEIHDAIVAFFLAELLMRVSAGGWGFLRSGWNWFDTLLILASFLPILGTEASVLRIARAARLLHLIRHLPRLWPAIGRYNIGVRRGQV